MQPFLDTATPVSQGVGRSSLKVSLLASDILGLSLAWWIASGVGALPGDAGDATTVAGVLAVAITFGVLRQQGLYLARVSSQRMIEARGVVRSCLVGAVLTAGIVSFGRSRLDPILMAVWFSAASGLLLVSRGLFRAWLRTRRRSGAYVRRVLVVGSNEEAGEFLRLVDEHPELGYRVVGVLGDAPTDADCPRVGGRIEDAVNVARNLEVTGAIVVASALTAPQLRAVTRDLLSAGIHVHVSSGLAGLSRARIRPVSFAHEPLLYVERPVMRAWERRIKRAIDLAGGMAALLVSLPLWIAVAVLIKLDGGGPVFFRQERVGIDGQLFPMLKFRTMVPDAEAALAALVGGNQRTDSPLFKMGADPRVTRVGRMLRATSLDELPQLVNVIAGSMSMVGPRPALASEVEHFDDELKTRLRVKPGMTGLWQIEARDHPSFGPYRRLDLFYVENWSLTLDLLILVGTVTAVGARVARFAISSLRPSAPKPL